MVQGRVRISNRQNKVHLCPSIIISLFLKLLYESSNSFSATMQKDIQQPRPLMIPGTINSKDHRNTNIKLKRLTKKNCVSLVHLNKHKKQSLSLKGLPLTMMREIQAKLGINIKLRIMERGQNTNPITMLTARYMRPQAKATPAFLPQVDIPFEMNYISILLYYIIMKQLRTISTPVKKEKTFHQKRKGYEILANLSANHDELSIILKPQNPSHYYQATLKNQTLSPNILMFFQDVLNVYSCLQDEEMHGVDLQQGQICIKINYQIKEKMISKSSTIQMEKIINNSGNNLQAASILLEIENVRKTFKEENQELRMQLQETQLAARNYERKINQYENMMIQMTEFNSNLKRQFDEIRFQLLNSREMNEQLIRENEKLSMEIKETTLQECKEIIQRQIQKIKLELDYQENEQRKFINQFGENLTQLGNKTEIQQNKLNSFLEEFEERAEERKKQKELKQQIYDERKRLVAIERQQAEEEERRVEKKRKLAEERSKLSKNQDIKQLKKSLEAEKAQTCKTSQRQRKKRFEDPEEKVECKQQ